jgi:ribosomal protein S11
MADKVKIWFDAEADYLEVQFAEAAGYMKETPHNAVMKRVDAQGHVIGFSVLGVSRFKKDKPLEAELASTLRPAVVREKPGKKYGK